MSDLQNRRNSPRRRVRRASGMHPGWMSFLAAYGSGIFSAFAMMSWIHYMLGLMTVECPIIVTVIAIVLFFIGGRKAENLTEREP